MGFLGFCSGFLEFLDGFCQGPCLLRVRVSRLGFQARVQVRFRITGSRVGNGIPWSKACSSLGGL